MGKIITLLVPAEADKDDPNDFHHFQVDWKQIPPSIYKEIQMGSGNWQVVTKILPPEPEEDVTAELEEAKEKIKFEETKAKLLFDWNNIPDDHSW